MKQNEIGWNFNNSYARLPEILFSRLNPVPVAASKLILLNNQLAENLNLDFKNLNDKEIAELFSGNILPDGAEPIAQAYAGHQYGHFTMLGDGRAILLGEHNRFDIQLKGSGPTPYSRQGDGRAALGPMLREYIISEAMFALGIPTTRSLAVVVTGENILRDTVLPGAILTRVAASHIRIGTFEYIAMLGDIELLKTMVHYCINRHYPHLQEAENPALELLKAVIEKQIILITDWMRVGFVHGVMNTDNMTISGETIDYGPCAFMDVYDPKTVFSSIDRRGRYAFGNQPQIAEWNLARFAETLIPLLHENQEKAVQIAQDVLEKFSAQYQKHYFLMMRNKLGLLGEEQSDKILINDLLTWMQENKADYTNTFYSLMTGSFSDNEPWCRRWQSRDISFDLMRANNPAVIPRNHKVEEALQAASVDGNLMRFNRMLEVLSKPYESTHIDLAHYQAPSEIEASYRTFCGT
ncbi:MAG: YdiU family protein [Pseudomonadota bacterium]